MDEYSWLKYVLVIYKRTLRPLGGFGEAPFLETVAKKGLEVREVKNDGKCVSRACAVSVWGNERKYLSLRRKIASKMFTEEIRRFWRKQ